MRLHQIRPELVDLAPSDLQPGLLYISKKYRAAVHLCCCGCGEKVVTPLSAAEWKVDVSDGYATLYPSIGNGAMACMSHYLIRHNRVIWCEPLSKIQAEKVFARDQRDLRRLNQVEEDATQVHDILPTRSPERKKIGWMARLRAIWRWLTS